MARVKVSFENDMALRTQGITLAIADNDGRAMEKVQIGKARLRFTPPRGRKRNAIEKTWEEVVQFFLA